jgi:hypothetical protein
MSSRQGRTFEHVRLWPESRLRCRFWFDAQTVIHRNPQFLLAPKIPLGRLDRNVTKEELDLIQFAAGQMA